MGLTGVAFDLYVNGEYISRAGMLSSGSDGYRMELPGLPSDYAGISEIRLVPNLTYLKAVSVSADTPVYDEDDANGEDCETCELTPDAEPVAAGSFMADSEDEVVQELAGCEIIIPLPRPRE